MSTPDKSPKVNRSVPEQKASKDNFLRKPGESIFSHEGNRLSCKQGEGFFNKTTDTFFGTKSTPFFGKSPVQAKLSVNEPGDAHEKEADAVADKVMRMPAPATATPPVEQKKEEELQTKEEEAVQARELIHEPPAAITPVRRKEEEDVLQAKGEGMPEVTPSFEQGLQSSKGGGNSLPDGVKQQMETGIGADFSNVRVHTGSHAAALSSSIQAQAFTHGSDIYFNEGKYSPGTDSGKHLLAHELTHTVQQGAAGVQRKEQGDPEKPAPQIYTPIGEGISLDIDMDGNVTDREVKLGIKIQKDALVFNFSHDADPAQRVVSVIPPNMRLSPATSVKIGSTDGIHPLEITIWGLAKETNTQQPGKKEQGAIYRLALVPGIMRGIYTVMSGTELASMKPEAVLTFDIPVAYKGKENTLFTQSTDIRKEAGLFRVSYWAGPKQDIEMTMFIRKNLDDPNSVICLFSTYVAGEDKGVQDSPDTYRIIPVPVPFEQLQPELTASTFNSVTYRFAPGREEGFTISYEMLPADRKKPESGNAAHSVNIYPHNVSNSVPQGAMPTGNTSFTRLNNKWKTGGAERNTQSLQTESSKEAFEELPKMQLPDNERQTIMNDMSMIVMEAIKQGVSTSKLYGLWLDFSYTLSQSWKKADKYDKDARDLLMDKANVFIDALLKEISGKGFGASRVELSDDILPDIEIEETNKYTKATQVRPTPSITTLIMGLPPAELRKKDFEHVRQLLSGGKFTEALAELRESYYLWIEDSLLNNKNKDEDKKKNLQALGNRLSRQRKMREKLGKETQLRKIKALYYPEFSNLKDDKGNAKYVNEKLNSIPLDLYYQEKNGKWYLYNFTSLTKGGELNEFENSEDKKPGDVLPPLDFIRKIHNDEQLGTGYLHYALEDGRGDIVKVEHEWSASDYIIAVGIGLGMIALALTGIGILADSAIVTATAGAFANAAIITTAVGESGKLYEDYKDGVPITATRLVRVGVDIATAVLPVVRGLKGLSSLAKTTRLGKEVYILTAAENISWLTKFDAAANISATVFATKDTMVELQELSEALRDGRIDDATFFWGVLKNVTMGAINVKFAYNDVKTLRGGGVKGPLPKNKEEFGVEEFLRLTDQENIGDPAAMSGGKIPPAPGTTTQLPKREPRISNELPKREPALNNEPPQKLPAANDKTPEGIIPGRKSPEGPLHKIENEETGNPRTANDKELVEVTEGPENKTESVNSNKNNHNKGNNEETRTEESGGNHGGDEKQNHNDGSENSSADFEQYDPRKDPRFASLAKEQGAGNRPSDIVKGENEAEAILQAQKDGEVINPARPNKLAGDPDFDFKVDGPPPYKWADVKTPVDIKYRDIEHQISDISTNIKNQKANSNDILHIVNLKNIPSKEKANFIAEIIKRVGKPDGIIFQNK